MMWILLFFAGLLALPFVIEAARSKMGPAARETAPGQFAELSQGITHFQWYGPETGQVAVCIHGLTTPSFVWGGMAQGLVQQGYRVLVYDLYGRGFSDRPSAPQDTAFFIQQLNDLLDHQSVDEDITLIGYSMGGAIATAFAAAQPLSVRQVILLAPAGMQAVGGLLRTMASVPFVGSWIMLMAYPGQLRKGFAAERELPSSVPGITDLQEGELNWRGFLPAVLSSLRGALSGDQKSAHQVLHREKTPVFAIWGQDDTVIPLACAQILQAWNPDSEHAVIDGAGHGVTYTHTDDILALIQSFNQPGD